MATPVFTTRHGAQGHPAASTRWLQGPREVAEPPSTASGWCSTTSPLVSGWTYGSRSIRSATRTALPRPRAT
eukprot:scaffold108299_cov34-Phaeocystis_antarctica.AAC.1